MKVAAGIYTNLFLVELESEKLNLVEKDRKTYPSLKELRGRISTHIYADGDKIYGYGRDLSELRRIGFKDVAKDISEIPKTVCRIILDGFSEGLASSGFKVGWHRFITQAFDVDNPIALLTPEIRLLKGCEYRTLYLRHPLENKLVFGLIIDLKFRLEYEGRPSSYYLIKSLISQKYDERKAREIIREIRVKTGDLTPTGGINTQASRFRYESVLNIVGRVGKELKLPTGDIAILSQEPTNIVIEV